MSIVLILGCGSTNVRAIAIAIDERGAILAGYHITTETTAHPAGRAAGGLSKTICRVGDDAV